MSTIATQFGPVEVIDRIATKDGIREDIGYQPLLERLVVIRQLDRESADMRNRGQFLKDARLLASMHHHSIVQVYEAGNQDNGPYVILEKLEGITLQQRLDQLVDQHTRMGVEEAVNIVRDVAAAVEHVHAAAALVHDISPANIMLTNDGRVVLRSLGQPLPENLMSASKTALAYAAPERLLGGKIDAHSDVYALGVLLYHLLFGALPFEGSAAGIIAKKQTAASLPTLDDASTELPCPYALAHLMRQSTNALLEQRYATVTAFRMALNNVLNNGGPVKVNLQRRPSYLPYQQLQLRRHSRHGTQRPDRMPLLDARDLWLEEETKPVLLARAFGGDMVMEQHARVQVRQPQPAFEAPVARHASVAAPVLFNPNGIDPLTPGLDNQALHAALPFTVLLPMPGEDAAPAPQHGEPRRGINHSTLMMLMLFTMASVGAAMALA